MGRLKKETIDYYPHFVKTGRTIFVLENKYGNDGYAFWFKLLEIIGGSDGHFYDCHIPGNWEYLLAKTRCNENTAIGIINTLINLGKIDGGLWEKGKVIWCQHLVDNVSSVYKMRHTDTPSPPIIHDDKSRGGKDFPKRNPEGDGVFHKETDIVKESKVKESKEEKRIYPYRDIVALWNKTCLDLPKVKTISDDRRQKMRNRLKEMGAETSVEMIEFCNNLFRTVSQSKFLCGDNASGWTASFDWLFENSKNWVKVTEGNYDNDKGLKKRRLAAENQLGVGEYVREDGKRTYGSGRAEIPPSAPKRPSERHQWNAETQEWILL